MLKLYDLRGNEGFLHAILTFYSRSPSTDIGQEDSEENDESFLELDIEDPEDGAEPVATALVGSQDIFSQKTDPLPPIDKIIAAASRGEIIPAEVSAPLDLLAGASLSQPPTQPTQVLHQSGKQDLYDDDDDEERVDIHRQEEKAQRELEAARLAEEKAVEAERKKEAKRRAKLIKDIERRQRKQRELHEEMDDLAEDQALEENAKRRRHQRNAEAEKEGSKEDSDDEEEDEEVGSGSEAAQPPEEAAKGDQASDEEFHGELGLQRELSRYAERGVFSRSHSQSLIEQDSRSQMLLQIAKRSTTRVSSELEYESAMSALDVDFNAVRSLRLPTSSANVYYQIQRPIVHAAFDDNQRELLRKRGESALNRSMTIARPVLFGHSDSGSKPSSQPTTARKEAKPSRPPMPSRSKSGGNL